MLKGRFFCFVVALLGQSQSFRLQRSFRLSNVNEFSLHNNLNPDENLIPVESTDRKDLWKSISKLEKEAIDLLSSGNQENVETAHKLLSKSVKMKQNDPFLQLAAAYATAEENKDDTECDRILAAMKNVGVPPHIAGLATRRVESSDSSIKSIKTEDVDYGSTFSDTVTEKIRVKITSSFDNEKSSPADGRYMFWYKVAIYNEGPEPVQIVARMWEIEKCQGEKEVVRGAGIMSAQPIIPPGDVFTYQSACPLVLFPPKGKRVLGSMSGAYTMCKGNMGQHNFTVKVGKFNFIIPESVVDAI